MKLYYSPGRFDHNWFAAPLAFEQYDGKRIKVSSSHPHFHFMESATLQSHRREDGVGYVTILGTFQSDTTAPSTAPTSTIQWTDAPNSPVFQQVRIALDSEAIQSINPVSDADYNFEISIPADASIEHREV